MKLILLLMLIAAMTVLFFSGYSVGVIKGKYGRNWLLVIPITIAIFMFNIILAIYEISKTSHWQ
ncbi:hypothetical protein [Robertmurraya sp. P23]|uniref:hypothetical protein n=1 Tax=Robertmurraya sp. P23 TaxID=3436931 RepID=UPI003D99A4AC